MSTPMAEGSQSWTRQGSLDSGGQLLASCLSSFDKRFFLLILQCLNFYYYFWVIIILESLNVLLLSFIGGRQNYWTGIEIWAYKVVSHSKVFTWSHRETMPWEVILWAIKLAQFIALICSLKCGKTLQYCATVLMLSKLDSVSCVFVSFMVQNYVWWKKKCIIHLFSIIAGIII